MTTAGSSGRLADISELDTRVEGRDAQSTNISAARALGAVVRTTLGPKGLDKMLVGSDGKVVVTNDGASILDRIDVEHPAAQMIVEVAAQQDTRTGDGTTTAVVLAAELLAAAETLLDRGLHPTNVTDGYHRAAQHAFETLRENAVAVDVDDPARLEEIARTVITGKWDAEATAFLAGRAVEAVRSIERDHHVDFEKITRKTVTGGSVYESEVVDGLIIDMESSSTDVVSPEPGPPRRIEDATIALVDDQLTVETVTGMGSVTLDSPDQIEQFQAYEDEVYETHVAQIVNAGADVVFCQKSIDDTVRYLLAKEGVLAVERTRQDELHKLGRATGARPVANTSELTSADVGTAGVVERRAVGPTQLTFVVDAADFDQVSILLRGGTQHVADETKRVIDGCFHVLKHAIEEGSVLPGGGATEVHLAQELRDVADGIPGREQFAVVAFAEALEVIPRTLAESAGLDPIDSLVDLRNRHHGGERTAGLVLETGGVDDVLAHGVVEPLRVKHHAVHTAVEAANMLLRVDDVIAASADGRDHGHGDHDHDHDHDHGPGGVVESSEGYPWAIGH